MKWRNGCFECSKADVMGIVNIHEVTLWVFWIFMRWCHWYFEYSRSDVMELFRSWRHGYFEIHIQTYTTSFEYSKYPWHHFKNIQNTNVTMNIQNIHVTYSKLHFWIFKIPMTSLQEYSKIPMTSAFEYFHDVTLWIFKKTMTSLHEFSKCLMGNLNIRMLTPWVFWKFMEWCNWSFYSWSDLMGNLSIHEVRSTVI